MHSLIQLVAVYLLAGTSVAIGVVLIRVLALSVLVSLGVIDLIS